MKHPPNMHKSVPDCISSHGLPVPICSDKLKGRGLEWTEWVTADAVLAWGPDFAFPAAMEEAKRGWASHNFSTEVGKGKGKLGLSGHAGQPKLEDGATERSPTVVQACGLASDSVVTQEKASALTSEDAHLRGCSPHQILTLGFLIPASSVEKKVELEWTYLHHGFYCWNRERLRYKKKQTSVKFVLLSLPPQCSSSSVWVKATNERRPVVHSRSLRTAHYLL